MKKIHVSIKKFSVPVLIVFYILLKSVLFSSGPSYLYAAPDGDEKQQGDKDASANTSGKAGAQSAQSNKNSGWILDGYAKMGYRLRFTRDYVDNTEQDEDFRSLVSLRLRDRKKGERFTFYMLGNLNLEIDGKHKSATGPYIDVYDTYRGNLKAQLYSAYIESHCSTINTDFIIGRQSIYKGEALDFDGLRAEYRALRNVNLSLYGGIPSNFWETSHEGDSLGGGGIEVGIPKKVSVRWDYIHIRDKKTYEAGEPVANDDLVVLSAKYTALRPFSFYGLYSHLENEERRTLFRAKWADKKSGLLLSATYIRQNIALMNYSTALTPYYIVLAEYEPFYQYKFMALKEIGRHLSLEAGADIRELKDEALEGVLNHSYERYYGSVHIEKLLDGKVDFTVTAETWNVSDNNDRTALEGLLKIKPDKRLKLSVGSDFARYKYDYNLLEEKENITSYFLRADYKMSANAGLRFKYSLEKDAREVFNVFELYLILKW